MKKKKWMVLIALFSMILIGTGSTANVSVDPAKPTQDGDNWYSNGTIVVKDGSYWYDKNGTILYTEPQESSSASESTISDENSTESPNSETSATQETQTESTNQQGSSTSISDIPEETPAVETNKEIIARVVAEHPEENDRPTTQKAAASSVPVSKSTDSSSQSQTPLSKENPQAESEASRTEKTATRASVQKPKENQVNYSRSAGELPKTGEAQSRLSVFFTGLGIVFAILASSLFFWTNKQRIKKH
ncbi:LPXTG cell wall anchor domain-containing protein [Enterococcus hulanensis]|uniref:LPXTG cell wall anchor domain-containing protein n=1 Tax=Enterococcus hulanensis TaxID=2559929 RepID=UPI00288CAA03|nr:LPXTG cell wall anchor domain-containing protein [Enterococcus hulanensis]MDT2661346.1 LPXTG cell wall anchor domain-containing protein [Enterococcus hulanensis]